jgi:hypothetical protein
VRWDFARLQVSGVADLSYKGYTSLPCDYNSGNSEKLRANPKRGIGFEEAQEIFTHSYYLDHRSDFPGQYRTIGGAGERLYSLIFRQVADPCPARVGPKIDF